jgi:membrane protein YqaA with SNARE-associated domain
VPLGFDALVIVLAATYDEVFWVPLLAAAASLLSAALTYWVGRTAGFAGLPRLVPAHHLDRMKAYLDTAGVGTLAAAAVMPPPFPLTAFLLTCGALEFDRRRFFLVFGVMRLVRFSVEALLARHYGDRLLQMLEADGIQNAGTLVVLLSLAVAIAFSITLWRRARPQPA